MSVTVTLPYNPVWTALAWAKKNCPSYITNRVHKNTGEYGALRSDYSIDYFFGDEKDALIFLLRWK